MTNYIITTSNLTKVYHGTPAVNDLNLAIPKNKVYGLLGANGAGKSTTLKMLTGIIRPTSGEIFFQGKPWRREDLLSIGALIENPPLYPQLSAYDNLLVRTTALEIDKSRISEVLQIVNLTDTKNKKVKHFSLGMKQRLGIALALINEPSLLILDEPTNGLDPLGIQELRELIKFFKNQGITVIISSHILSEIEQIADHIGIIAGGKLGYDDNSNETVITEHIKNIRQKIRGYRLDSIETVWGIGYRWKKENPLV